MTIVLLAAIVFIGATTFGWAVSTLAERIDAWWETQR